MGARPQTIGPYTLETRLGAGGMGEVYQAYDKRLDRWVAIKLIRPEHVENAMARERFRREARAAARLSHPSIVQIYDVVESDESDAIVLELVEGEPLSRRIARGPLPVEEAVRFGRQIAEGLAAAHARGLVHRDLKPENVMVTLDGQAKILDFGLAKQLEGEASLTEDQRVVGTFRSMSPEQARGLPVDHRSDLFSLGILLYEMLSGRSPFDGGSTLETLTRICSHRQAPLREVDAAIPEPVSGLVDRLLEKDPMLRPADAREVARVLAGADAGAPERPPVSSPEKTRVDMPLAATEPLPARPARSRRFAKKAWLAGAAALLLLALGAGLLWRLRSRPPEPLYVAVPRTEIVAGTGNEKSALMASGLRVALVRGLLSLSGIAVLAPEQVDAVPGSPVAVARATAADELVTARLDCGLEVCRIELARISGRRGGVLWTQAIQAPADRPFLLIEAVRAHLREAYPDHQPRDGDGLQARPQDYDEYLRLRQEFEKSQEESLAPPEMARLDAILRESPRFLEARLFEAEILLHRFQTRRDREDLGRAAEILDRARELSPADPRPLFGIAEVELRRERPDQVAAALRQLDRLQPGDADVLTLHARLLDRQGKGEQALALIREVVRRNPSWKRLYWAADLERRHGNDPAARAYLEQLLERFPGHKTSRSLLARMELATGSPERALALYREIVQSSDQTPNLVNLGLAYLLLGRYPEADPPIRLALSRDPRNPQIVLNLADVCLLQGKKEEASRLYQQAIELIDQDPGGAQWQFLSNRAQALAHLGRGSEAVETVQRVLQLAPDDPDAAFEASLVYALVGERQSALVNARKARALGIGPRWFSLPWFDPLRSSPEFRGLLAGQARAAS